MKDALFQRDMISLGRTWKVKSQWETWKGKTHAKWGAFWEINNNEKHEKKNKKKRKEKKLMDLLLSVLHLL